MSFTRHGHIAHTSRPHDIQYATTAENPLRISRSTHPYLGLELVVVQYLLSTLDADQFSSAAYSTKTKIKAQVCAPHHLRLTGEGVTLIESLSLVCAGIMLSLASPL